MKTSRAIAVPHVLDALRSGPWTVGELYLLLTARRELRALTIAQVRYALGHLESQGQARMHASGRYALTGGTNAA